MPTKTKSSTPAPREPAPLTAPIANRSASKSDVKPDIKADVKGDIRADTEADETGPQSESKPAMQAVGAEVGDGSAPKKKSPGAELAAQIVAGSSELGLAHYARTLEHENPHTASQAARVMEEVVALKPELAAPHIERLVRLLTGENTRVVQGCATMLPALTRVAPAKVARHLERLRNGYDGATDVAKDGMVRIFVALCVASVAYQKRVIDVLERALSEAEPKTLLRWTELVLPALKGEPHAQARAVVEQRLPEIPRPQAEKIAEFLGIRLRPARPA